MRKRRTMKAMIGYCKPNPSIHPTRAHYRNTEPDPVLNSSAVQKVPPRLLVIPPDHWHMQWESFQASLGQVKLFGLRMLGTERRGMEQEEAKKVLAKMDAFWNIHKFLQSAGLCEELCSLFPVKRGDNWKEAIRACNPALSKWHHIKSRYISGGRWCYSPTTGDYI